MTPQGQNVHKCLYHYTNSILQYLEKVKFKFDKQTTLYDVKIRHRPVKVITQHIVYFIKYSIKWDNRFIEYISLMGEIVCLSSRRRSRT